MAYPTILVHVDDSARAAERIRLTSYLANRVGGHVIGAAATGVSRFLYHSLPPDQHDATLTLHLNFLREQARTALATFSALCDQGGTRTFETRIIDDDVGAGISLHARTADLIVLGQTTPDAKAGVADLPAYVITNAGRPVMLVPFAGHHATAGRRILVSWDGGREAARALQLALPLLKDADEVNIAVFEVAADEHRAGDAFAADPRPWLARHGVQASMTLHAVDHQRRMNRRNQIGERLLSLAADVSADLLVMGGYGHSRIRESLLGGVTRTVLEEMTLPVLMAH